MTVKGDNLRAIDRHYLTASAQRARRFLEHATPSKRARTLESHLLHQPNKQEQELQDDIDSLLRYYSVLELASVSGAIEEIPAAEREVSLRDLSDEHLRRYYEWYYPQLLPQLHRARLSGHRGVNAEADCTEDFLRLVSLDVSRDDQDIATFVGFLDEHPYVVDGETHDLSSVLRTIADPDRFLASISAGDDERTPTDEGVTGFLRFLSFSRDLDDLLRDLRDPLVRSCFWHHYGHWYQQLGGHTLGALLRGIHILREYVPTSPANAAEARALARTQVDMSATVASLQLLTSSVYRVRLEEEFYGARIVAARKSAANTDKASAAVPPPPATANAPRRHDARPRGTPVAPRENFFAGAAAVAAYPYAVAYERSIGVENVYAALEDALATAARKYYQTREPLEAQLDRTTGSVVIHAIKEIVSDKNEIEDPQAQWTLDQARKIDPGAQAGGRLMLTYITKEVVDVVKDPHTQIRTYEAQKIDPEVEQGDEVKIPLTKPPDELGRIAAQSAKQVLYQKVREAEREKVYNEFKDKYGELENGYVKRFERGEMIIDLNGKTEGIIPRSQQSRAERYSQGDRIKAVIIDVHTQPKGPQVVLSRTDPRLLIKLFEMEVPEIYDGTVVIKGAVREPGERAKIAVMSRDRNKDAVRACTGPNGSHVQSVTRELQGEKIDIVLWDEDLITYAQHALAPATIARISITSDELAHWPHLEVIVDDNQLSLAIGKRGINVRLAAELIGAKIDIKSVEEAKGETADSFAALLEEMIAESRRSPEDQTEDVVEDLDASREELEEER